MIVTPYLASHSSLERGSSPGAPKSNLLSPCPALKLNMSPLCILQKILSGFINYSAIFLLSFHFLCQLHFTATIKAMLCGLFYNPDHNFIWLEMNFTTRQTLIWSGIPLWSMWMLTCPEKASLFFPLLLMHQGHCQSHLILLYHSFFASHDLWLIDQNMSPSLIGLYLEAQMRPWLFNRSWAYYSSGLWIHQ